MPRAGKAVAIPVVPSADNHCHVGQSADEHQNLPPKSIQPEESLEKCSNTSNPEADLGQNDAEEAIYEDVRAVQKCKSSAVTSEM